MFGQVITPGGAKVGSAFPLLQSAGTNGFQNVCGMAFDGTNYLVVWQDTTSRLLYGQLVTATGALSGGEFLISTQQNNGHAAALAFGATNYLVVWQSNNGPSGNEKTYGAFVSKSGVASRPFQISQTPSIDQNPLAVAFDGTNFLVVWNQDSQLTPFGGAIWNLYGRLVSSAGTFPGSNEMLLSTNQPLVPALAFDGSNYLLGWSFDSDTTNSDHTVRFRFFDRFVTPLGPEFTPFETEGTNQPLFPGVIFDGTRFAVSATLGAMQFSTNSEFQGFASGVVYGTFIPRSTAPPRLDVAGPLAGAQFPLLLTGTPGINYAIQTTPNFALQNWSALVTNSPTNGTFSFNDNKATNVSRFYRTVKQ
jgi:hypothetical protein